ncbi:MAG: hypothetical protein ACYCUF_05665 [Acidimicrobiales bacterium]
MDHARSRPDSAERSGSAKGRAPTGTLERPLELALEPLRLGEPAARRFAAASQVLQLQRQVGNRAVTTALQHARALDYEGARARPSLQRMPTSADVIAKAGPPKQDKKIMGLFKWGMSTRYKRVLAELDRYDARTAANTSTQAQQRKVEAKSLQEVLASIGNAANAYIAAHSSSKDPESKVRTSIMGSLVQGAVSEGVQLPAIAADSSFDVGGKTAGMLWKTAIARHLASDSRPPCVSLRVAA